jgi:hypothetical protein
VIPQDAGSKIDLGPQPVGLVRRTTCLYCGCEGCTALRADLDEALELLDEANAELDVDAFVGWCMRYDALVERRKGKACT